MANNHLAPPPDCMPDLAKAPQAKRQRRAAEETREEILNMAEVLFRTHGYASVSIADIAAGLAMSPANVFKHFRTKISLVDAIATRVVEQTVGALNALDQNRPAPDRLHALAHHLMLEHLNGQKDAPYIFEMILVMIQEELDCSERFRALIVEIISDIIKAGINEGTYHVSDVPRFANAAFDALSCVCHPVMIGMEKADILATRCDDVIILIDAAMRSPLAK